MELCKIIVVDDEFLLRQGIIHMLDWEKYGFTIAGEAGNATQALELIEKVTPHIILCDIVMPNMDGIELSKIIKKRYPKIEVIILSGYDNFDYVKTAFKYGVADYVLKPTLTAEQLLNILVSLQEKFGKNIKISKKQENVSKHLLNMLENKSVDQQLIETYFKQEDFTVIGYKIYHEETDTVSLTDEKINDLFSGLNPIFLRKIDYVYRIIVNHSYEEKLIIDKKWDEFIGSLERTVNGVFAMKINRIKSIEDLFKAYDGIKDLGRYYFYGYEPRSISVSLSDIRTRDLLHFDTKVFMQKATTMGPVVALDFLGEYLDSLNLNNGVQSSEVKATVQNCIYNLINLIPIKKENYEQVNTKKILFFNNVSAAKTLDEVKNYFLNIGCYLKELIGTIDNSNKMMNQIKYYIQLHYNEQISLQNIADELHISYSYLSAYFNSHHKESFNDYLNKIRIEKAKEFLVDPDIQISYISELTGYSSPGYFAKVFKKSLGVTPSTYRRMYMK